jgi:flagellar basal body-associated protein FliL
MKKFIIYLASLFLLCITSLFLYQTQSNWNVPFPISLMIGKKAKRQYIQIPRVVANFPGRDDHQCRASFTLEVSGKKSRNLAKKKHETLIRDTIVQVLASRNFESLQSIEGKILLKRQIRENLNRSLPPDTIKAVYFSELLLM